ncbi:12542_t:CDS:2 [Gigaspora rosea]|nr:12542_t:CDS:2 [Gigaspora rosea]
MPTYRFDLQNLEPTYQPIITSSSSNFNSSHLSPSNSILKYSLPHQSKPFEEPEKDKGQPKNLHSENLETEEEAIRVANEKKQKNEEAAQ